jgi:hypothetical protein
MPLLCLTDAEEVFLCFKASRLELGIYRLRGKAMRTARSRTSAKAGGYAQ